MSQKSRLVAAIVVLVVLAASLGFLLFWKQTPPPEPALSEAEGAPPPAIVESEDRHAALNVYVGGAVEGAERVDRIELTLLEASIRRDDGKAFSVMGKPVGVSLQGGVAVKAITGLVPAGRHVGLVLTFAPNGRIVSPDGSVLPTFLPVTKVMVDFNNQLPVSRTLNALIVLPVDAVGVKNNAPIFTLPSSTPAETTILGGIFMSERSIGNVWRLDSLTLTSVIQADFNLDITPTESQGSEGFVPAEQGP